MKATDAFMKIISTDPTISKPFVPKDHMLIYLYCQRGKAIGGITGACRWQSAAALKGLA